MYKRQGLEEGHGKSTSTKHNDSSGFFEKNGEITEMVAREIDSNWSMEPEKAIPPKNVPQPFVISHDGAVFTVVLVIYGSPGCHEFRARFHLLQHSWNAEMGGLE